MSQTFINGAKYAFSTTVGAAVALTAISNASPAIASGGSLPSDGDIVMLQSNWTDLNEQATYAGAAGVLNLIDTTNESDFPPGESSPASYQVMSDFVNISQIRDIQQSGGDTNTFNFGYIDDRSKRQRSIPTDKNPLTLTFTLDYDADLPWIDALEAVSKTNQLCVMRETLPSGDVLLYTGYISYQPSPTRVRNENMTVTAVMLINSETLRFPAAFFAGS